MIQWYWSMSEAPTRMSAKRITRAPTTPQNRTRCWSSRGTANAANTSANTNTLSTLREYSMTYPVNHCDADLRAAPEEHADAEHDRERHPDRGPDERLAWWHDVCGLVEDAQVERQEEPDEDQERDPEDQIHVRDVLPFAPERIGGPGHGPRGIGREWARPRGGAQGREDGDRMAAERPGGYAARKLRNRRTRSAMGGWVLNS